MRARGDTPTEISNDYAAFLDYAMLLGASFVTCNPPLVDIAWVTDPERWNPVVDRIVREDSRASPEALATKVTLEIVLANMRLLRPVFLLTEGSTGYVSLQVNPKNHDNASAMVSEATIILLGSGKEARGRRPKRRLQASRDARRPHCLQGPDRAGHRSEYHSQFWYVPTHGVCPGYSGGRGHSTTITNMSGRLAFPVRDELLGILDRLTKNGDSRGIAKQRPGRAWRL